MKVHYIFDIEEADDKDKLKIHQQAEQMFFALNDFYEDVLRSATKYGTVDDKLVDGLSPQELADIFRDLFLQILREREINLDV